MNYKTSRRIKIFYITVLLYAVLFGVDRAHALTLSPVRFELRGDPGQVLTEKVNLMNEEKSTVTYYTSFANFQAQGETGSPTFVDPTDDIGTWMSATDSISLEPNESKTVNITVRIPENAEPGGHFGAVFWGTAPKDGSGQVSVGARTGVLVLLTVNGDVSENGGVIEFDTKDNKIFFTSLPVPFYYRFQNSGGDRIKPEGDIKIRHILGWVSARVPANQIEGNILPNSTRRFEVNWKSQNGSSLPSVEKMGFFESVGYQWKNFGFGYYRANLKLVYGADGLVSKDSVGFFVIPWQLLIILGISGTILWYGFRKVLRKYHSWVINKAKISLQAEMNKEGKE